MAAAQDRHIEAFLEMLAAERGVARNTLHAYSADLADFATFAASRGAGAAGADSLVLRDYLARLHALGLSARTAARRLSALSRPRPHLRRRACAWRIVDHHSRPRQC